MKIGVSESRPSTGFTLLELILAIVLFMTLSGAIVFSFTNLQKNTQLDEGVERLLTVVRYAKAHAAVSGRPMQFQLVQSVDQTADDTSIRILWEPDPIGKPGETADLAETVPMVEAVNDFVHCELPEKPQSDDIVQETNDKILKRFVLYPDGSGDSGRLIVTSRDGQDVRRFLFELIGITGELRKRELNTNEFTEALELALP
ncbi:MAG: pilus assembly FimT family protein [Verrucomicrobiia bacterium]|jgi:type II secretory pathway pseudopilin PulG